MFFFVSLKIELVTLYLVFMNCILCVLYLVINNCYFSQIVFNVIGTIWTGWGNVHKIFSENFIAVYLRIYERMCRKYVPVSIHRSASKYWKGGRKKSPHLYDIRFLPDVGYGSNRKCSEFNNIWFIPDESCKFYRKCPDINKTVYLKPLTHICML